MSILQCSQFSLTICLLSSQPIRKKAGSSQKSSSTSFNRDGRTKALTLSNLNNSEAAEKLSLSEVPKMLECSSETVGSIIRAKKLEGEVIMKDELTSFPSDKHEAIYFSRIMLMNLSKMIRSISAT
jgi:hypothetical protein